MENFVYVVVGTTESVGQNEIGGPFEASYPKECIAAFPSREQAEAYIANQKLAKARKDSSFSGTAYFKKGYYEMEIEQVPMQSSLPSHSLPPAGKTKPYTVEPHGKGWAIYRGRDASHHGETLGLLTECSPGIPQLVEEALKATVARTAGPCGGSTQPDTSSAKALPTLESKHDALTGLKEQRAGQRGNKPPEVLKDKDGYPTEEALDYIRNFPLEAIIERPQALMDFIKSIWEFPDWGWKETPGKNMLGNPVIKYYISTGGWSGNESIISALRGHIFWSLYWESSRTGGHFTFEVKKPATESKVNKKSGKGKPVKAKQKRK